MTLEDALKVMGLSDASSAEVARARYKELAMELHPDHNPMDPLRANELMAQLNAAWSVVERRLQDVGQIPKDGEQCSECSGRGYVEKTYGLYVVKVLCERCSIKRRR